MYHRRYILVVVGFLLTRRAESAPDIDRQERSARAACLAGDYAKGVGILSELFVATEDSTFIYNQGRCFEQNHRYEDAISRFQEFLRVGRKLSKADKTRAQKHIADCQALLEKEDRSKAAGGANDSKDAIERAARKACLLGNVDKGSEILGDLYLDDRNPTHIYNLGRCYEQNHRYDDAVSRFREYLIKAANLSEADRKDTEKHIASCLAYLGKPESPQASQTVQHTNEPSATSTAPQAAPPAKEVTRDDEAVLTAPNQRPTVPNGTHAGQPGLFFRYERVLVPGLSYGVVGGLEIEAGALLGHYKGTWLALRWLFLDGAIKPGITLGMPLFVVDQKAVVGIQGGALVQWDYTYHFGLYASLGFSYFPSTASDLGSLWILPAIGAQVRL